MSNEIETDSLKEAMTASTVRNSIGKLLELLPPQELKKPLTQLALERGLLKQEQIRKWDEKEEAAKEPKAVEVS